MNIFDLLEKLKDFSRELVDIQIKIINWQDKIEKYLLGKLEGEPTPNKLLIEYFPGHNRELKITSYELYPPKVQTYVEAVNKRPKKGITAYSKNRNLWFKAIRDAKSNNSQLDNLVPFNEAIIWFRFVFNDKRLHDPDNYTIKFINDSLVKCGILLGDDGKRVKYIAEIAYDSEPRVEIVIKEGLSDLEKIRPKSFQKALEKSADTERIGLPHPLNEIRTFEEGVNIEETVKNCALEAQN